MMNTNEKFFPPSETEQSIVPAPSATLNRRKFFKLLGGGLAVAFVFDGMFSLAGDHTTTAPLPAAQVGAWIHIGEDGVVSVYTGKVEVGQNIRTSLSQMVAEELKVPISSIKMIMGDTELVPFDAGTFGSLTTPRMGPQLRKAAATARESLIEIAAKNWNTDRKYLQAKEGWIVDKVSNKKVKYGELTKGQQLLLQVSENVPLIAPEDWQVAGKTVTKINGRSFITGKHTYVSDMKMPGMLYGKVLRPPAYNSKLIKADTRKAAAIPGVTVIHDGNFIGVTAPRQRIAEKAIALIDASWETNGDQPSRAGVFEYLLKNTTGSGRGGNTKGDVDAAFSSAAITHASTHYIDYIAHIPLEPRAALAEWKDDKLTVWTGTQRPFGVQQELAEAFGLSKEKVRVIMPDTGSGYGGKHSGEAAVEAARLARFTKKPVKLVWSREEEFTWAYFRPGGVIEVKSGMDKDGNIVAWSCNNYNSGPSGLNTQYKIANHQLAHHACKTPLKQGSYRGLAATANVFAREAHIGDMARLLKMDQLEFRLRNLGDERLKAVLEAAAKAFGWNTGKKAAGRGFGVSCGFEKGGYVAACAEVTVDNDTKQVRIHRITQAFECGAIVNPLHLENQILGSLIQGLGGALFEAVDFSDGKILNAKLSAYRVPRFKDTPKIEIVMLDRKDIPSAGAGEAAIVCVAPAIRNAILDASGVGLQSLPMIPTGRLDMKSRSV